MVDGCISDLQSCEGKGVGSELRSVFTMVVGFAVGVVAYGMMFISVVESNHTHLEGRDDQGNGLRVASLAAAAFLRAISSSLIWVSAVVPGDGYACNIYAVVNVHV